jgi:hypothetical protein
MIGASLLFGLMGLGARQWREHVGSRGTYASDTYDVANNLMHTSWALAVVAAIYVAVSLLLTPRTPSATTTSATPIVPQRERE